MSPETGEIIIRICLAVALSAVIGCERSLKLHSAGLRTFMVMATASCAAMLTERMLLSGDIAKEGSGGLYLISAAVLIGGASISVHALFRNARNQIQGLTTAAALWGCCVIGMACGAGFYVIAVFSALMLLLCLIMMPWMEDLLREHANRFEIHLELVESTYLKDFITTLRRLGLKIDDIELNRSYRESKLSVYSISLSIDSPELKKYKSHSQIIEALSSLDYVLHIEEM
ncbi:MAG: MgtC/SapB family protein [Lachnospiraceae bacterium]|nr:MgtC/SapB family protein [Lachnospiraceae bacterium]